MQERLDQLQKEEKQLLERKANYEVVQAESKKFIEEFEQSVRQEQRLLTEISNLLYHSEDRHFFHEQQQQYVKECRQVINQIEEESYEIKRQTSRLSTKLNALNQERFQLEKNKEGEK